VGWEVQPAIVAAFTISGFFDSTAFPNFQRAFVASFAAWARLPAERVSITTQEEASAACAVVPTQAAFQVQAGACANMLASADQALSSAAALSGATLDAANSGCALGASSAATSFASLADLLCCPSLSDVVATMGTVTTCQGYAEAMQSLCNGITGCGTSHGSRRLQVGTATAGTSIALTVLTQGMSSAQVTSLEAKLAAILADSGAFFDAFGLILLSVGEQPNQETIGAPLLPDSVLAQTGGGVGGGGGNGWIGGVFGAFGSLAGIAGLYCWHQDRQKKIKEAGMMQMMDDPANGRGRTPTLAKHTIGGGHAAGSEMVAHGGQGQLSSAI
jgi:hypothetical protein